MEDSYLYFYLETWKELSTFFVDRKKAETLKKDKGGKRSTTALKSQVKSAQDPMQVIYDPFHSQSDVRWISFRLLHITHNIPDTFAFFSLVCCTRNCE